MKYCKDCRWFAPKESMCISPKCGVDLVTGKLFARDAKLNRYQLERTGCGEQAQWFEPLPEMDDDEHIEMLFDRGVK